MSTKFYIDTERQSFTIQPEKLIVGDLVNIVLFNIAFSSVSANTIIIISYEGETLALDTVVNSDNLAGFALDLSTQEMLDFFAAKDDNYICNMNIKIEDQDSDTTLLNTMIGIANNPEIADDTIVLNGEELNRGNITEDTSSVLIISGGTGATIGNVTIRVKAVGASQAGYLSSADWNTFNNKQDTLGFTPANSAITINTYPLTGNITLGKSDIGLGNVDNTADKDKPISTAQQTALNNKKIILSSISGFGFICPDSDFADYANSANIEFNRGDYGADAMLVSTSSNEPVGYPLYTIPANTASLKFREVFKPESGYGWNGETVVFKAQYKKMTNNVEWSTPQTTPITLGTFTAPSAETPSGDTTLDSAVITNIADTSNLAAGMIITGSGIPADTTIASVDSGTQITISNNATATASTVSLTCKSTAPQLYEATLSLATLGLVVGDIVNFVQRVDISSTYANDIALMLGEIEVVAS